MSNDKVGDTPRTDLAAHEGQGSEYDSVPVEFARQLERELSEYKRLNAALTETLEVAQRDAALKGAIQSAERPRVPPPEGQNTPVELDQVYRDLMSGDLVLVRNWFGDNPYCGTHEQQDSQVICRLLHSASAHEKDGHG